MKILIADDDRSFLHSVSSKLSGWGYQVAAARDGAEAWNILHGADAPRLAVLDWMMPGMDGVEICRALRRNGPRPYVYVLLLSSRDQKGDLVEGMEAGADDYMVKPFDAQELRVRLRAGRRILELEEALMNACEVLQEEATRDGLTGALNRRGFLEAFRIELARAQRECTPLAMIMVDLDQFKKINDSYGHMAGDSVLRELVHRMQASVRPYDQVGRYGGDEFLVLLPHCDEHGAMRLADRIKREISEQPVDIADGIIQVSASLGVVSTLSHPKASAEELIDAADQALYRAKREGRNRVATARTANTGLASRPPWTAPAKERCQSQKASSFDLEATLQGIDGDWALLREIVALFVEESPKLQKYLREAIDRLDREDMRRAAHALKGAVANFHAGPAKSAASRLEEMGKNGDFHQADATYVLLESELKRLTEDLAQAA